jgi:hypothetical protein
MHNLHGKQSQLLQNSVATGCIQTTTHYLSIREPTKSWKSMAQLGNNKITSPKKNIAYMRVSEYNHDTKYSVQYALFCHCLCDDLFPKLVSKAWRNELCVHWFPNVDKIEACSGWGVHIRQGRKLGCCLCDWEPVVDLLKIILKDGRLSQFIELDRGCTCHKAYFSMACTI